LATIRIRDADCPISLRLQWRSESDGLISIEVSPLRFVTLSHCCFIPGLSQIFVFNEPLTVDEEVAAPNVSASAVSRSLTVQSIAGFSPMRQDVEGRALVVTGKDRHVRRQRLSLSNQDVIR